MKKIKHLLYHVTNKIQLWLWVVGINIHNHIGDECCPDFACCNDIRTPFKKRLKMALRQHKLQLMYTGKIPFDKEYFRGR